MNITFQPRQERIISANFELFCKVEKFAVNEWSSSNASHSRVCLHLLSFQSHQKILGFYYTLERKIPNRQRGFVWRMGILYFSRHYYLGRAFYWRFLRKAELAAGFVWQIMFRIIRALSNSTPVYLKTKINKQYVYQINTVYMSNSIH